MTINIPALPTGTQSASNNGKSGDNMVFKNKNELVWRPGGHLPLAVSRRAVELAEIITERPKWARLASQLNKEFPEVEVTATAIQNHVGYMQRRNKEEAGYGKSNRKRGRPKRVNNDNGNVEAQKSLPPIRTRKSPRLQQEPASLVESNSDDTSKIDMSYDCAVQPCKQLAVLTDRINQVGREIVAIQQELADGCSLQTLKTESVYLDTIMSNRSNAGSIEDEHTDVAIISAPVNRNTTSCVDLTEDDYNTEDQECQAGAVNDTNEMSRSISSVNDNGEDPIQTPAITSSTEDGQSEPAESSSFDTLLNDPIRIKLLRRYNQVNNTIIEDVNTIQESTHYIQDELDGEDDLIQEINQDIEALRDEVKRNIDIRDKAVARVIAYMWKTRRKELEAQSHEHDPGEDAAGERESHLKCASIAARLEDMKQMLDKWKRELDNLIDGVDNRKKSADVSNELVVKIFQTRASIIQLERDRKNEFIALFRSCLRIRNLATQILDHDFPERVEC